MKLMSTEQCCDECRENRRVVAIEHARRAIVAWLCADCLRAALKLLEETKP